MAIKIFIDQGHNPSGFNAGAEGNGLREQDVVFQVGIYLRDLLNADPRFDARVSRQTITEVLGYDNRSSLKARVDMANDWGANYFLSIHCNASTDPALNGTEVYVYNRYSNAYFMAQKVLSSIVRLVGTRNNGVRENKTFYVLRKTTMPALLIELAYITNVQDAEKLRDNQYGFANAIYLGILEYFGYTPL